MPREAPDDHAEAAANLRAKAHRVRLLVAGILDEQAVKGLREYADDLESQADALEPPQVIPPET